MSKRLSSNSQDFQFQNPPGDISSIPSNSGRENSQFDMDLEQVNMQELILHELYQTKSTLRHFSLAKDSQNFVYELFQKMMNNVNQIAFENEMMKKVPCHAVDASLIMTILPVSQDIVEPEDPQPDIDTGGLEDDEEPTIKKQDQWIRSKIQVQTKITYEQTKETTNKYHNQSYVSTTMMKKQQQQHENQKNRKGDLDPAPIDLSEPLDISHTEETMRNEKERQLKEKQDVILAENRRIQREMKEEQLKYELIAKDKKSKQYTYDYDGKLIPVQMIKTHKLPSSIYNIHANFQEDPYKLQQQQQGQKQKKKTQIAAQILGTMNQTKKKTPEDEKDFVKFMTSAPPILDTMQLSAGVNLKFDGKLREGPRPSTVDLNQLTTTNETLRMPRKDYFDIVKQGNLNRQAQTMPLDQKLTSEKTREIDGLGSTLFTFERLKRQQQHPSLNGGIKINSTKVFETLTHTIPEDDELIASQLQLQKKKELENKQKIQTKKSPVDEFNLGILHNQNWGKDPYVNPGGIAAKDGLLKHKPRDKDIGSIIGTMPKKPREREVLEIRAKTSQEQYRNKNKS